jgi:phospholipid transport system substrate-binding protein
MKPMLWLPMAAVFAFSGVSLAQPPQHGGYAPGPYGMSPYRGAPRTSPGAEASAVLREGIDKLVEFLGKDENKLQVAAFLDKEIAPYFDFDYMAKWVAGPRYARMGEDAREALAAKLEARFLGTLARRLAIYDDQQVRFFRPRMAGRGTVSVSVGILRPGSYPAKLEFRMYRGAGGWKIYDVLANGRSASAYYRMQLNRTARPSPPMTYGR